MKKPVVEVYARKDCSLCGFSEECVMCGEVMAALGRIKADTPFEFREVDIDSSEDLSRRFRQDIPTVFINGSKSFKYKVDEAEFRKKLRKEIIKAELRSRRARKASGTPDKSSH